MTLNVETTVTYQHCEDTTTRFQHHVGGTRSGKTYGIIQWLIIQAIQRQLRINIVRKSHPALRRTAMRDFKEAMASMGIWELDRWHDSRSEYTFASGATMQFISADDEQKLRGVKSDYLFVDEANELNEEEAFQLGIRTSKKIIWAYNPTISPYHWLRKQYGDKEVSVHHTTYKDNPFLPQEQINAIEDLQTKNPKYWSIYGLGEYAGNDRQIYGFKVIDEIPSGAEFICYGIDFGFSSDPTAMVGLWKWGDNIYLREHLYEPGLTTGDIAGRFRKLDVGRKEIWGDSAEPRLIEELHRQGFNIKPVKKGPDSIRYGIALMLNYNIHIEKGSQNLLNEFYSYQWATDKSGTVTDTPESGLDHLADAARYAGMMRLGMKSVTAGKYTININGRRI